MNRSKKSVKRIPNPAVEANLLSQCTFWWLRDLFREGYRRPLFADDLYENLSAMDSEKLTDKFENLWKDELNTKNPSMLKVIGRAYGPRLLFFGILFCLINTGYKAVQIYSLGGLVSYFAPQQMEISKNGAFMYGAGIVIPPFVRCILSNQYMLWTVFIGTRVRVGCCGLLYRKILGLPKVSSNDGLSGRAINLLSNDLAKIDVAVTYVEELFRGPVEIVFFGYLMYSEIGLSALIGVGFMLLFIPVQAWAARKSAYFRHRTAERTDIRVKFMNEIIHGIQVIKMYAWEKCFVSSVEKIRQNEISAIRGTIYIQAALKSIYMVSGVSVFLTLVSYVLFGDVLTAKKVFMVSSIFQVLNGSFIYLWSQGLTSFAELYISTKRLTEFLLEEESKKFLRSNKSFEKSKVIRRIHNLSTDKKSIIIDDATAYWNKKDVEIKMAMNNINLEVNDGELLAVIGPVGCGKSSFLNIIIGELELDKGLMTVNGSISYSCQETWIFEGRIRDNIVFIEDFDETRYKKVIQVCALEKDFQLLPHGDLTVVGERGISLSGGQKARVSLARAIYKEADIYLLDDPLSAVDIHVGRHIFEKCIIDYLKNKICVLVTHQLQFLKEVQNVIIINAGKIEAQGRFRDVVNVDELKFVEQSKDECEDGKHSEIEEEDALSNKSLEKKIEYAKVDRDEHSTEGSVRFDVYKCYFKSMDGYYILFIVLGFCIAARTVLSGIDYFLSRWVIWEQQVAINNPTMQSYTFNNNSNNVSVTTNFEIPNERLHFIINYAILLGLGFLLFLCQTYGFLMMCLRISLRLHGLLFRSITRATMRFFNINSSGRILNRFSRDLYSIDSSLPPAMLICAQSFLDVTANMVIVGISNYWLFIPTFVIVIVFYVLKKIYVETSRSLKRIESVTRSPIYSHTNQTFQGLTTIRAFYAQEILEQEFHMHQNINTSAWCVYSSASRALALWLDLVCVLYIGVVTFSFLLMEDKFESGVVGLAIMNCINMVGVCQWGIRQTAEVENQMTSVERVVEYINEPSEAALETPEMFKPPEIWPGKGGIKFIHAGMRYAEHKECVLKDLHFNIKAREKIGIVGRTGAGKSSIIQSLFRLAINEGVIEIDDVNINNLGLHDLRYNISIIPQDPVLFSGTLRYNLDPFGIVSDSDVWKALGDVELKRHILNLKGGLDYIMFDGGSNFSVGQRQLVCLARAILRNNRILILDEATANVDPETDKLIQNTIRAKFSECTVLTIAHRLHTVMDSDRILVMSDGRAVEIGHPYILLSQSEGHLKNLVARTGNVTAAALFENAKRSFDAKRIKLEKS